MSAVLALIAQVLGLLPSLTAAGISIAEIIVNIRNALNEAGAPGDAEWDALDTQVKQLEAQFQKDAAAPTA